MLIRLIISPADEIRSGANQMRQHVSFREHFRRGNADRSGNQDRNPVSRYWHDCRGVIVAQAELRFWMSRRGDQALAVIVAWVGGRPRPRLRSSAARRR